jgi:hypothetical protein
MMKRYEFGAHRGLLSQNRSSVPSPGVLAGRNWQIVSQGSSPLRETSAVTWHALKGDKDFMVKISSGKISNVFFTKTVDACKRSCELAAVCFAMSVETIGLDKIKCTHGTTTSWQRKYSATLVFSAERRVSFIEVLTKSSQT